MTFKNYITILCMCMCCHLSHTQPNELSVNDILRKTQLVFTNTSNYSIDLNYKMFGNYTKTIPMEEFDGLMVKKNKDTYLKINNTVFLTSESNKVDVKVFEDEKTIEVGEKETNTLMTNSPVYLESFIKLFKYKTLKDKGNYYVCTLTTDVITQIPYGKIELYILKESFIITKQVLYFLAEYPFIDENGIQQKGNPKMEVTLFNFQNKLSEDEKSVTNLSKYILKTGVEFKTSATYKDFKIIQN